MPDFNKYSLVYTQGGKVLKPKTQPAKKSFLQKLGLGRKVEGGGAVTDDKESFDPYNQELKATTFQKHGEQYDGGGGGPEGN